jgi:PncC family amidohydrolase
MMQSLLNQLHKSLLKKELKIAVAESCTGGLLCKLLTDIPGSSAYFALGIVAYSNQAKEGILAIPRQIISRYGAVSAQSAKLMAWNIRRLAKVDLGLAITGIAGPGGGSVQKPLGTVFIAIATKDKILSEKLFFKGSRTGIRLQAALKGLELLRKNL